MALNKLKFNSLNVTPVANKAVGFNSSADGLEATLEGGNLRLIKKLTASSSSTLSFVDGSSDVVLDNTYKEYLFIFTNIHSSGGGDDYWFGFQASTDGGSNYNTTVTSNVYAAYNAEGGGLHRTFSFRQQSTFSLGQETGLQRLCYQQDDDNQIAACGILHIFDPSSTTFMKHFIARGQTEGYTNYAHTLDVGGYFNTTSAIDAIQFKMNSGNIDAGTITLYGIN